MAEVREIDKPVKQRLKEDLTAALDVATDFLPVIGTSKDIYKFQDKPGWETGLPLALGTMIPGGKYVGKGALQLFSSLKAAINRNPELAKQVELADRMRAKGASSEEIGSATSMYTVPDVRRETMYYNFPESVEDLNLSSIDELISKGQVPMRDLVKNDLLMQSVPWLKNMPVKMRPASEMGTARGQYVSKPTNYGQDAHIEFSDTLLAGKPEALRGVISHETGHHGQKVYGASFGTSPELVAQQRKQLDAMLPYVTAGLMKQGVKDPVKDAFQLLRDAGVIGEKKFGRASPPVAAMTDATNFGRQMAEHGSSSVTIDKVIAQYAKTPKERLIKALAAGVGPRHPDMEEYLRTIGEGVQRFSQLPYENPLLMTAYGSKFPPLNQLTMDLPTGVRMAAEATPHMRLADPSSLVLAEDMDEVVRWLQNQQTKAFK